MLVFPPWLSTSTPHAAVPLSARTASGKSRSMSSFPAFWRMDFRFGLRPRGGFFSPPPPPPPPAPPRGSGLMSRLMLPFATAVVVGVSPLLPTFEAAVVEGVSPMLPTFDAAVVGGLSPSPPAFGAAVVGGGRSSGVASVLLPLGAAVAAICGASPGASSGRSFTSFGGLSPGTLMSMFTCNLWSVLQKGQPTLSMLNFSWPLSTSIV
mmetsp:Transcript_124297/g.348092  ORF Transcript_124297/g.348092 Transcript_124297/m.348092 type:complete len:208 (+) Transcript_124297:275-898(+)